MRTFSSTRILFAHPDRRLSGLYLPNLQEHFLMDSAHDGLTALRKFKLNPSALVVSDYHLPQLSGLALLRFIRGHPQFSPTPFVFLTDHPDNSEALSLGANDWIEIQHSFPSHLIEKIYYHLSRTSFDKLALVDNLYSVHWLLIFC